MSEEKIKAEALRRARTLQPGEGSPIEGWQKIIEENEAHEAQLYAQRGYGGYINSEQLEAIRQTTQELVENIERERRG